MSAPTKVLNHREPGYLYAVLSDGWWRLAVVVRESDRKIGWVYSNVAEAQRDRGGGMEWRHGRLMAAPGEGGEDRRRFAEILAHHDYSLGGIEAELRQACSYREGDE